MATNLIMQINEVYSESREQAGIALAHKIADLRITNAVVVGVPHGGVCVAASVAELLQLPLEVMICRKIKHPANAGKSIGSVSANEVIMHDWPYSAPQGDLYFQTINLRNQIKYENDFYYGREPMYEFEGKTVILVDDILTNSDTILACVREIRRRRASRIIVAVPFVEAEAAKTIHTEVEEMMFLKLQQRIGSPFEFYRNFPEVQEWKVRDLLKRGKEVVMAPIALYGTGL